MGAKRKATNRKEGVNEEEGKRLKASDEKSADKKKEREEEKKVAKEAVKKQGRRGC